MNKQVHFKTYIWNPLFQEAPESFRGPKLLWNKPQYEENMLLACLLAGYLKTVAVKVIITIIKNLYL